MTGAVLAMFGYRLKSNSPLSKVCVNSVRDTFHRRFHTPSPDILSSLHTCTSEETRMRTFHTKHTSIFPLPFYGCPPNHPPTQPGLPSPPPAHTHLDGAPHTKAHAGGCACLKNILGNMRQTHFTLDMQNDMVPVLHLHVRLQFAVAQINGSIADASPHGTGCKQRYAARWHHTLRTSTAC